VLDRLFLYPLPFTAGFLEQLLQRTLTLLVVERRLVQARQHGFLGDYLEDYCLRDKE
jgi:hypothetical protein